MTHVFSPFQLLVVFQQYLLEQRHRSKPPGCERNGPISFSKTNVRRKTPETVDGRNPAPPGMYITLFMGFLPYQLVSRSSKPSTESPKKKVSLFLLHHFHAHIKFLGFRKLDFSHLQPEKQSAFPAVVVAQLDAIRLILPQHSTNITKCIYT